MAQPSFKRMWEQFPDHDKYPTLTSLHTFIGGQLARNIEEPGFGPNGNTCAVRMSRALNYGGLPISGKLLSHLKLSSMAGADHKHYLFRVREMKVFIANALGVTPVHATKDFQHAFAGKRGIVAFAVSGWSDASGHVALWDGSHFREEHDNYAASLAAAGGKAHVTSMTLWHL